MNEKLKDIKLFVLDMDGTIYLGDEPIPGAFEWVKKIGEDPDRDFIFFTNNASKVPSIYVEKLAKLGLDVGIEKIVTAGDVCAQFLKENYPSAKIYLNGTPALEENWRAKGLNLVKESPDVCVQSFDTTLTYEKLDRICHFIRNGADFIATHKDINCPTEYGFMPDCGAMCELIKSSTGVAPRFFGKPYKETVDMLTSITDVEAQHMAFVGDRLYTDVATGVNNGAVGILVLSGESTMQTVKMSDVKPTAIYNSICEIS